MWALLMPDMHVLLSLREEIAGFRSGTICYSNYSNINTTSPR
jgi:hypothetical protein